MNQNIQTFVVYDTLKRLTDAVGVAGDESPAAAKSANAGVGQTALELLREYAPNAAFDCHGSVVGIVGSGVNDENNANKPLIMLDAHIDQIGLIVTHVSAEGFVKAEPCGGVDRRCLASRNVIIHGNGGDIKGVICTLPPHVMTGKDADKTMKNDSIWIDTGLKEAEVESSVSLGDSITMEGELTPLLGKKVSGAALDDRAGVCAILYALFLLKRRVAECALPWRVAVSFSVQEELGCRGAAVTAYNIEPEYAIAVDVSYGMSPGCVEHKCGKLGGGAMIGYAPSLNRPMFEMLKNAAIDKNIPHQIEIMNRDTGGTNADVISLVKGGVKTALVSIPLRYMHTSVETADLGDIEATGRLIAAFLDSGGGLQ